MASALAQAEVGTIGGVLAVFAGIGLLVQRLVSSWRGYRTARRADDQNRVLLHLLQTDPGRCTEYLALLQELSADSEPRRRAWHRQGTVQANAHPPLALVPPAGPSPPEDSATA